MLVENLFENVNKTKNSDRERRKEKLCKHIGGLALLTLALRA